VTRLYADVGGDGSWDVQIRLGISVHPQSVLVTDVVL